MGHTSQINMVCSALLLASLQGPSHIVGLVTDPWLQLTSSPSGMVVEFITHSNPKITIDANGLYVKKIENMALKTDDLELQKFIIGGLKPDSDFRYALVEGGSRVEYTGHSARDSRGMSRLAILGDSGSGGPQQKQIAELIRAYDPNLMVHVGDVAYPYGQEPGYIQNHFGVYGNILSRTPMVAAAGNHDTTFRDYAQYPGGLAYYKFFNLPKTTFPWQRDIGNYGFSYGSAYWLILDSNLYNNWKDPRAQAWLQQEFTKEASAKWKFVAFHDAPWHSSNAHADETHMRALDQIFKKNHVNIVFSGQVHNYERSRPDPTGPLYIVTGAGGADLDDSDLAKDKCKWKPYTLAIVAGYSYTQFEYDESGAILKQVLADGTVVDTVKLDGRAPTNTKKPTKKSASKNGKG